MTAKPHPDQPLKLIFVFGPTAQALKCGLYLSNVGHLQKFTKPVTLDHLEWMAKRDHIPADLLDLHQDSPFLAHTHAAAHLRLKGLVVVNRPDLLREWDGHPAAGVRVHRLQVDSWEEDRGFFAAWLNHLQLNDPAPSLPEGLEACIWQGNEVATVETLLGQLDLMWNDGIPMRLKDNVLETFHLMGIAGQVQFLAQARPLRGIRLLRPWHRSDEFGDWASGPFMEDAQLWTGFLFHRLLQGQHVGFNLFTLPDMIKILQGVMGAEFTAKTLFRIGPRRW